MALLLLAVAALCGPLSSVAADSEEILRLDSLIGKKADYDKLKYTRIGELKKGLSRAASGKERFGCYMEIGEEFTLFKADSAISYYNKAIAEARLRGDTVDVLYARIKKVRPVMISGFYAEAHDELRVLQRSGMPPQLLPDFYECGYRIYSFALNSLEESSQFYGRYSENVNRYRTLWIASLPDTSRIRQLYEAEQAIWDKKTMTAKVILGNLLSSGLREDSNEYALATAFMGKIFKMEGDREECMRYLAMSSISDIRCSVKENQSIYELSMMLYGSGDIARAYRYIFSSIEDAAFCNAQMRMFKASSVLPVMESAQREAQLSHERMLMSYILISCLLLVGLVAAVLFLVKQMKRLTTVRAKLKEANMAKDEYMGQFLELCSIYMKRLDSFTKTVSRKLSLGQGDDLMKMIKSQKFSDEQHGRFYQEFDNAFLKIYTTFVADVNALLRPEERYVIDSPSALNTELRIYALYRLGIEDSSKIAEFLRYSVNTIYTYRNKVRNKAINRDTFEHDVMKIGVID